jgi:hypothetical protein
MLADILFYVKNIKVKQQRHMSTSHSLLSDMNDLFAELDNTFRILKD